MRVSYKMVRRCKWNIGQAYLEASKMVKTSVELQLNESSERQQGITWGQDQGQQLLVPGCSRGFATTLRISRPRSALNLTSSKRGKCFSQTRSRAPFCATCPQQGQLGLVRATERTEGDAAQSMIRINAGLWCFFALKLPSSVKSIQTDHCHSLTHNLQISTELFNWKIHVKFKGKSNSNALEH